VLTLVDDPEANCMKPTFPQRSMKASDFELQRRAKIDFPLLRFCFCLTDLSDLLRTVSQAKISVLVSDGFFWRQWAARGVEHPRFFSDTILETNVVVDI